MTELEYPEKMCEYCCNFDKEHIGMDGMALCKLTMTLACSEDYGGNCMFYNVPKEQIIVPPCNVGDTVWFLNIYPSTDMKENAVYEARVVRVCIEKGTVITLAVQVKTGWGTTVFPRITDLGKTVFLSREDAEKALKERSEGK
jgi:hypothetical protein